MIKNFHLNLKTAGYCDIQDLTPSVERFLRESQIRNGLATVFVSGSTAGLTTLEYEPGLIRDMKEFFESWIPSGKGYHHDDTWHDGNGFSHLRSALLKPSLSIPIIESELALGTWQQVVLVDFDNRSRSRAIVVQIFGEA